MGKEVRGGPAAPALSRDPERSIGAYLARQRELRGFSLDDLATMTRIPRRSLERLESGVFDHAADGFVRGFVRTVAAALGLDPDEAVMRLLREPDADAPHAPARASRSSPELRGAAIALGLVLALAAVGWLLASLLTAERPAPVDEVVLRRDPVRALVRDVEEGRIRARPRVVPPPAPPAPEAIARTREPAPAGAEPVAPASLATTAGSDAEMASGAAVPAAEAGSPPGREAEPGVLEAARPATASPTEAVPEASPSGVAGVDVPSAEPEAAAEEGASSGVATTPAPTPGSEPASVVAAPASPGRSAPETSAEASPAAAAPPAPRTAPSPGGVAEASEVEPAAESSPPPPDPEVAPGPARASEAPAAPELGAPAAPDLGASGADEPR